MPTWLPHFFMPTLTGLFSTSFQFSRVPIIHNLSPSIVTRSWYVNRAQFRFLSNIDFPISCNPVFFSNTFISYSVFPCDLKHTPFYFPLCHSHLPYQHFSQRQCLSTIYHNTHVFLNLFFWHFYHFTWLFFEFRAWRGRVNIGSMNHWYLIGHYCLKWFEFRRCKDKMEYKL